MKKMQIVMALLTAVALVGCTVQDAPPAPTESNLPKPTVTEPTVTVPAVTETAAEKETEWFSNRDLDGTYDASEAETIHLEGNTAQINGDGAVVSDSVVTITQEGVYVLTGNLENGQIVIDADKNDKVQLVLNNVEIISQTSAAIYAKTADKVFLTLPAGTQNELENGGSYGSEDDNKIDSVIFSKTDLTLNGSGSLTINAAAGHGIVSKDELTITGGQYEITAAEHGIVGKDSVAIAAGSFTVTAGEEGIRAKNSDDAALGNLYIADGVFVIDSMEDGISATGFLRIDAGTFQITTGGGSKAVTMKQADSMGGMHGGWFGERVPAQTEDTEINAKGIKSDGSMTVKGGSFRLDTADDAVHTNGDLEIGGGEWNISTADDGLHADGSVTIRDGSFNIPYCYEGIEGSSVTIDGGSIDIVSVDDGINAAGGSSNFIVVNGGTIRIVSDGDSLDSNGTITFNGGTLDLVCNGNGNTAVDCDRGFTNNGAEITTNDGSENGNGFGFPGGGPGGAGGGKPPRGGFGGSEGGEPPMGGFGGWEGEAPSEGGRGTPNET